MKEKNSDARLRSALNTKPDEPANEFGASVAAFSDFVTDHNFFPGADSRDKGKNAKSWKRTYGWAMSIQNTGPRVAVSGGSDLDFAYVSREIVPTRTKPAVPFVPAGGLIANRETDAHKVSVDLIFANATTGRPIVAELKLAADKNPFTGLVQASPQPLSSSLPHSDGRSASSPRDLRRQPRLRRLRRIRSSMCT